MRISEMIKIIKNELDRPVTKGKDKVFVYPYKLIYKKHMYSIIFEHDKSAPVFTSRNEDEACTQMINLLKGSVL